MSFIAQADGTRGWGKIELIFQAYRQV